MKYELRQLIHYMLDNKIHSAQIQARKAVDFDSPLDWNNSAGIHFGDVGVTYYTCHGVIKEEDAYPSKEALIESLWLDDDYDQADDE